MEEARRKLRAWETRDQRVTGVRSVEDRKMAFGDRQLRCLKHYRMNTMNFPFPPSHPFLLYFRPYVDKKGRAAHELAVVSKHFIEEAKNNPGASGCSPRIM